MCVKLVFSRLIIVSFVLLVIPGLSLTAMWTCVAHTGYFVVCAVLLTFLRCPGFSRALLLLTVPLNAVAEVNQQPALDLTGLSLLLLSLSLGTNCFKLLSRQILTHGRKYWHPWNFSRKCTFYPKKSVAITNFLV